MIQETKAIDIKKTKEMKTIFITKGCRSGRGSEFYLNHTVYKLLHRIIVKTKVVEQTTLKLTAYYISDE